MDLVGVVAAGIVTEKRTMMVVTVKEKADGNLEVAKRWKQRRKWFQELVVVAQGWWKVSQQHLYQRKGVQILRGWRKGRKMRRMVHWKKKAY